MKLDIWRLNDIRGKVEQFTDEVVQTIGRELAKKYSISRTTLIGYDKRDSSLGIARNLARGFELHGARVELVEGLTTPIVQRLGIDLHVAIMVTGSHNDLSWNGMKIFIEGRSLCGSELIEFSKIVEESLAGGEETMEALPLTKSFITQYRRKNFDGGILGRLGRRMKVCVFGPPAEAFVELCRPIDNLEIEVIPSPVTLDPMDSTQLLPIIQKLKEKDHSFDFGIAFDSDGDRIRIVEPNGNVLSPDSFALFLLRRRCVFGTNNRVVLDVKLSEKIVSMLDKSCHVIMVPTGRSIVSKAIREYGAAMGFEASGHVFFKDGLDDAFKAALEFIRQMVLEKDFKNFVRPASTDELRFPFLKKIKADDVIKNVLLMVYDGHLFDSLGLKFKKLLLIDGIRVVFEDDSWFVLRASNTEDCLIARAGITDPDVHSELLEGLKNEVTNMTIDSIALASGRSKMYYECHVTIEPIFDDRLMTAQEIAKRHGFRVAELLMQRRKEDTQERSKDDTFMTGRSSLKDDLISRMRALMLELSSCGFMVWRYKIEDTIIDSKIDDVFGVLKGAPFNG